MSNYEPETDDSLTFYLYEDDSPDAPVNFVARLSSPQERMNHVGGFADGSYRQCPVCGGNVDYVDAYYSGYEPSLCTLYVRPCDCRLGMWEGVPQWLRDTNKVIAHYPDDNDLYEPTIEDLIADGHEVELTEDYWREYNAAQEAAGQLRLPLQDDTQPIADDDLPFAPFDDEAQV